MLDWLKSWLNDIVKWFADFAEWIPKKLFSVIMGQVAEFINAIPVPDFVLQAKAAAGNLPASVLYWADVFELRFGLATILGALIFIWVKRKLPFIGGR